MSTFVNLNSFAFKQIVKIVQTFLIASIGTSLSTFRSQTNFLLNFINIGVSSNTERVPNNFRELAHNLIRNYCLKVYNEYPGPQYEDYSRLEPINLKLFNYGSGDKVFYFIHGGGFFFSRPETYGKALKDLSKYSNSNVAAIEYRKIPENYVFACLEDALSGYLYLTASVQTGGKGFRPSYIVIGGDSAGGGMVAMITHFLRNTNQEQPAAALMWSPNFDLTDSQPSQYIMGDRCIIPGPLDKPIIDGNLVIKTKFWEIAYRGVDQRTRARIAIDGSLFGPKRITYWPILNPMLDPDLSGLSPMLIMSGEFDTFRDPGIVYARRIFEQKVQPKRSILPQMTVQIYQDQPHDFITIPLSVFSDQSIQRAANFIKLAQLPQSSNPQNYSIQNYITASKFGPVPELPRDRFQAYYQAQNRPPILYDPPYQITPFPVWEWANISPIVNYTSLISTY